MTRRELLLSFSSAATVSCLAGQTSAKQPIVKPSVLRPGDTVGIISPATQVTDPGRQQLAQRTVEYLGLKAKWARNARNERAQSVATVEERIADIHQMFQDPQVRAVFCIRGGYGAGQLVSGIDYELIRRNPKIFVGYSDITALPLAFHKLTGLVTFHGPVLLSEFTPYTLDYYRRTLFQTEPLGRLSNPPESNKLRPKHTWRTIHGGTARGRLSGGNLTLISSLMGTPYEIETDGRIFFTEDVGEEAYRIDRMLTQLRIAGKLKQAAGIVFGECLDCGPNDFKPSFAWNMTLGEVLDDRFSGISTPVLSGLTIGHTADQLTLPIGVMASLDATNGVLTIEESATV